MQSGGHTYISPSAIPRLGPVVVPIEQLYGVYTPEAESRAALADFNARTIANTDGDIRVHAMGDNQTMSAPLGADGISRLLFTVALFTNPKNALAIMALPAFMKIPPGSGLPVVRTIAFGPYVWEETSPSAMGKTPTAIATSSTTRRHHVRGATVNHLDAINTTNGRVVQSGQEEAFVAGLLFAYANAITAFIGAAPLIPHAHAVHHAQTLVEAAKVFTNAFAGSTSVHGIPHLHDKTVAINGGGKPTWIAAAAGVLDNARMLTNELYSVQTLSGGSRNLKFALHYDVSASYGTSNTAIAGLFGLEFRTSKYGPSKMHVAELIANMTHLNREPHPTDTPLRHVFSIGEVYPLQQCVDRTDNDSINNFYNKLAVSIPDNTRPGHEARFTQKQLFRRVIQYVLSDTPDQHGATVSSFDGAPNTWPKYAQMLHATEQVAKARIIQISADTGFFSIIDGLKSAKLTDKPINEATVTVMRQIDIRIDSGELPYVYIMTTRPAMNSYADAIAFGTTAPDPNSLSLLLIHVGDPTVRGGDDIVSSTTMENGNAVFAVQSPAPHTLHVHPAAKIDSLIGGHGTGIFTPVDFDNAINRQFSDDVDAARKSIMLMFAPISGTFIDPFEFDGGVEPIFFPQPGAAASCGMSRFDTARHMHDWFSAQVAILLKSPTGIPQTADMVPTLVASPMWQILASRVGLAGLCTASPIAPIFMMGRYNIHHSNGTTQKIEGISPYSKEAYQSISNSGRAFAPLDQAPIIVSQR